MEEVEVHTVLQEFHEGFMGVLIEGFIRLIYAASNMSWFKKSTLSYSKIPNRI